MTTTPTVAADRALRRRTLERRSASLALTGSTRWVLRRGIWWWLAFVFVFTVVTGRIASWTGSDEPFRITQALPLVLAFQAMSWWRGLLRVYVLAGGTRRSALLGGLIAAPVVGALFAAVQAAFTLVVSWSLGLSSAAGAAGWLTHAPPWPLFAAVTIAATCGLVSGVAISAGFRALGGWRGLLALPVLAAPLIAAMVWLNAFGEGAVPIGIGVQPWQWVAATGCPVVAGAMVWLLVRRVPIDEKRSLASRPFPSGRPSRSRRGR